MLVLLYVSVLVVDDETFKLRNSSELKFLVVSTWTMYEEEPKEFFQYNVREDTAKPVLLFDGESNTTQSTVWNCQVEDQPDVSALFIAQTRQ